MTGEDGRGRVLDVTRLCLRVGRDTLTGIDRIERAYLHECLARPEPLVLLLGWRGRQWLLPRGAGMALLGWLAAPPRPSGLRELLRLGRGGLPALAARRLAAMSLGCARPAALGRLLAAHLPRGGWLFNVGHLNAAAPVLAAARGAGLRVALLLHDTIPLDFPQLSRPHAIAQMRDLLKVAGAQADLVICNSAATQADLLRHGLRAPMIVAHPGTAIPPPAPHELPGDLDLSRPFFLALGTIEPRKNHAFLLDLWDHLAAQLPAAQMPGLLVLGRRGWMSQGVFGRLDAAAGAGLPVRELPGLSDGAVAALMARARALLMPSLAEGYGLPLAEAMAAGLPVIASPLPVFHEIAGDYPVYLATSDLYPWAETIKDFSGTDGAGQGGRKAGPPHAAPPTWAEHFRRVFMAAC